MIDTLQDEPQVRPYSLADRSALLGISADTAFFGDPVEAYLDDRQLFQDAFYRYYTDFEPEHAWVVRNEDAVGGFLAGCINTAAKDHIWRKEILPSLLRNFLYGRYRVGRKTLRFAFSLLRSYLRGEIYEVDFKQYPAHLHINLAVDWRGDGNGQQLMAAYLEQLVELGVRGVHLHTTSYNTAACRLYESLGFDLLDERPTTLWQHLIDTPIINRAYGLSLLQATI